MFKSKLYFYLLAVFWLPLSVVLFTLPKGFNLLDILDQDWRQGLAFATLLPTSPLLPLACRAIWRLGYRASAVIVFVSFAPLTAGSTLLGGMHGAPGVFVLGLICSLPVWLLYAALRIITKVRAQRAAKHPQSAG